MYLVFRELDTWELLSGKYQYQLTPNFPSSRQEPLLALAISQPIHTAAVAKKAVITSVTVAVRGGGGELGRFVQHPVPLRSPTPPSRVTSHPAASQPPSIARSHTSPVRGPGLMLDRQTEPRAI